MDPIAQAAHRIVLETIVELEGRVDRRRSRLSERRIRSTCWANESGHSDRFTEEATEVVLNQRNHLLAISAAKKALRPVFSLCSNFALLLEPPLPTPRLAQALSGQRHLEPTDRTRFQ